MTSIVRWLPILVLLILVGCGGRDSDRTPPPAPSPTPTPTPSPTPTPGGYMNPSAWSIGPVIDGQNYSHGMQARPSHNDGWSFAFPQCTSSGGPAGRGQSVNYLTTAPAGVPISGSMSVTYEIVGSGEIVGKGSGTPRLRLHFQRRGDNWSGTGVYNGYRWWSRSTEAGALTPGRHTLTIPLDFARWGAVQTAPTQAQFNAARQHAGAVGFTFGDQEAAGHGVCVRSGSARFVLKAFTVR